MIRSFWRCEGLFLIALAGVVILCGSCIRPTTDGLSGQAVTEVTHGSMVGMAPDQCNSAVTGEGRIVRTKGHLESLSKIFNVDRIYKSMTGPWSRQDIRILDADKPELVWITGAHVEMVDQDGREHMPELFMCHANLDLNLKQHGAGFVCRTSSDGRLFTLSQGQLDVTFPAGFGIPVMSDEPLDLVTQVLNLNFKDQKFRVRHRVTLDFVRDRDAIAPMKPLYQGGVYGLKTLADHEMAYDAADSMLLGDEKCTSCCLPGMKAVESAEGIDRFGRKFTGHWVVKPGREVNRTRATTMFDLSADTTIHYIAVHMHPFAESLELRDLTTGESLFKSEVRNFEDQIGLAHVDSLSSPEGVPVYADHEYEIVSVYNNTSGEDQDSMAVMYVYLFDHDFRQPATQPDDESLTASE